MVQLAQFVVLLVVVVVLCASCGALVDQIDVDGYCGACGICRVGGVWDYLLVVFDGVVVVMDRGLCYYCNEDVFALGCQDGRGLLVLVVCDGVLSAVVFDVAAQVASDVVCCWLVIVVVDVVLVGVMVQFQVRDVWIVGEDLIILLRGYVIVVWVLGDGELVVVLVFMCNGCGLFMFGDVDYDVVIVVEILGDVFVVGMFCVGELGFIGQCNALHGFIVVVVVFREFV